MASTADIRNVVLLGHGDAGKTTLADQLLVKTGAPAVKGARDKGSVFDFEPEEKERGCSVQTAAGHLAWKGKAVNLVDAPGYPDFIGDAICGINAADLGLICVNAHSGVMVNTRRVWGLAGDAGLPRAVVITKCDLEEQRLGEVLASVQEVFGERCIPWRAPDSVGDFADTWTEAVVEADDDLMMRYLDGEGLSAEEVARVSREAVRKGTVTPVVFTSSESDLGLDTLLDMVAELGPSPADRPATLVPLEGEGEGETLPCDPEGPFVGLVWNVVLDKHVGKIGFVRVMSGSLKGGAQLTNVQVGEKEKVGNLQRMQGREPSPLDAAQAGDLAVVSKMESLQVGNTLTDGPADKVVRILPFPLPMYNQAITPKSRGDETKLSEVLAKLQDETPTFRAWRETGTGELVASGVSQQHLDLMLKRMKTRFGLEVETHRPKIPYKETIMGRGESRYRHKKQTGGRGQFAEVALEVAPAEAGAGLDYSWDIFGGAIPSNYSSAIEKGIREKMVAGCIAGYPMEDVSVSIKDGKHHEVDSSEAAFKMAGGKAFHEAVLKAKPVILEPYVSMEITIPGRFMGDISGDLNTRRGRIQGMDQMGAYQVIRAEVPLAEALDYSRVLTSITSGEGTFSMEPSRYEQVPANVQQQLTAAFKPRVEED